MEAAGLIAVAVLTLEVYMDDLDITLDPVIELYKKDIDRTLIRENLKRTPEERLQNLMRLQQFAKELQRAGREAGMR